MTTRTMMSVVRRLKCLVSSGAPNTEVIARQMPQPKKT